MLYLAALILIAVVALLVSLRWAGSGERRPPWLQARLHVKSVQELNLSPGSVITACKAISQPITALLLEKQHLDQSGIPSPADRQLISRLPEAWRPPVDGPWFLSTSHAHALAYTFGTFCTVGCVHLALRNVVGGKMVRFTKRADFAPLGAAMLAELTSMVPEAPAPSQLSARMSELGLAVPNSAEVAEDLLNKVIERAELAGHLLALPALKRYVGDKAALREGEWNEVEELSRYVHDPASRPDNPLLPLQAFLADLYGWKHQGPASAGKLEEMLGPVTRLLLTECAVAIGAPLSAGMIGSAGTPS